MAKAIFHRHQKVYVEPVGTWAVVEKVNPVWVKGFDEPVRVTYDVGLGREFHAHELKPEDRVQDADGGVAGDSWRLMRAKNKWQQEGDCAHHPFPGTYPVVVTDPADWGGWRTPGAEYDREPARIERQARLIASAPRLQAIARELIALVAESPDDAPPALLDMARRAAVIERYVQEVPSAAATPSGRAADAAA